MKIKSLFSLCFFALILIISCKRDEINFETPNAELKFSRDTVFCDTIYNQVRSETYAVKVFNTENRDIFIPKISLQGGNTSPYRINVDGKAGVEFRDVPLRKHDSLYIFVEIAPVANSKEAIAEDRIIFSMPKGEQHITLFSVVQDAEFFIQTQTNPNLLSENTNWTSDKAKIIFGELTLAEGKTLSVAEGTKIYFTKGSGLKISKNAKLNLNGALDNEILLRGDRNDTRYDTIPLNWKGIRLEEGASLNANYAKIFGGETGIQLYKASATLRNTIMHSFQDYGIRSINSQLQAENLVMNSCGGANLALLGGGEASLTHCTLANEWKQNYSLPAYGVYATNEWTNDSGNKEINNLNLKIQNSILYGSAETSIFFEPVQGYDFNYLISHSLVKYSNKSGFNFDSNALVVQSIKNEDPKFARPYITKMNLRLKPNSPAIGKGSATVAASVSKDIKGEDRTSSPNLGAYQTPTR